MISRKIFFGIGAIVLLSQSVVCFCMDTKSQDIVNDAIAGGIATFKASGSKAVYKGDAAKKMQNYKSVIDLMVSRAGINLGAKQVAYNKMFEGVISISGGGAESEALKKTIADMEGKPAIDQLAVIFAQGNVGANALDAVQKNPGKSQVKNAKTLLETAAKAISNAAAG